MPHPKGSLAKGAACRRSQFRTAAFYASLLPRPARYRRCSQRLPACGSWHGEAVTEGACGRCSCGLIMGRYLLVVVDTQPCTAVTIPGGSGQRHKKIRDCCKMGILQQSILSGVYSVHKFQEVLEPIRGVLIHTGVLQHLGEYPSGLLEEKIQGVFCREGVLFL